MSYFIFYVLLSNIYIWSLVYLLECRCWPTNEQPPQHWGILALTEYHALDTTCGLVCSLPPTRSLSPPPQVLGQDDTFWWQACKYGSHSAAGLIPSQQLEERRRAYGLGENGAVGCLGRRKQKRQLLYSSHHNGCEWVGCQQEGWGH